jgi:hypothetical protein
MEEVELWKRDPVQCVQELIGNPRFCDKLRYAPCKQYTDVEKRNRVFDEMSSADWWWDVQV